MIGAIRRLRAMRCDGPALAKAALLAVTLSVGSGDPSFGGRSATEWAARLHSAKAEERVEAASAFAASPPRELDHVRPLLVALADVDSIVRATARRATDSLCVEASGTLVRALRDTSVIVRRGAALALGHLRDDGDKPIEALLLATRDIDDSVRTLAVLSLGQRSAGARAALGRIRELAITSGPQRAMALAVLANIDTESRSMLDLYLPALDDTSAVIRETAVSMLLAAAGETGAAMPLLEKSLKDSSTRVRSAALRSLALVAHHDTVAYAALVQASRVGGDTVTRALADSLLRGVGKP